MSVASIEPPHPSVSDARSGLVEKVLRILVGAACACGCITSTTSRSMPLGAIFCSRQRSWRLRVARAR